MNHLPFKDWLLAEEPLTQEQNQAFQEHLRECADCRQAQASWSEVQHLFKRTSHAAPSTGFTDRWQSRLAAHKARRQHRQLGLVLTSGAILALAIILMIATQLSWVFQSPGEFLLLSLAQLASLFVFFSSLQDYLTVFFRSFPLIPLVGLVFSVGLLSLLSVLWLTAYQQLVIARRFTK